MYPGIYFSEVENMKIWRVITSIGQFRKFHEFTHRNDGYCHMF